MKIIKGRWFAGFCTMLASYAKFHLKEETRFVIQLNFPLPGKAYSIYNGKKKPRFRNLYIIAAAWLPFYLILGLLFWVVALGWILFGSFYYQTLFRKSFITDRYGIVSGFLSLTLSIVGFFYLLTLLF